MFTPGAAYKLAKNFNLSLSKMTGAVAKSFGIVANKEVTKWKKELYKKLSVHAAANIVKQHKQRPDDSDAPHFNKRAKGDTTPHLRDSIRADVISKLNTSETKRIISIVAGVGIIDGKKLAYAEATNDGAPRRKDGTRPSWENWMDKAMLKRTDIERFFDDSGKQLPSMHDIFDSLFLARGQL
jgi:hypothetical protein